MSEFKIELGAIVKDEITGFCGTVVGRVEYLTGCRQYSVSPKAKDNDLKGSSWFDEDRLTVIGSRSGMAAKLAAVAQSSAPGGPQPCPAPAK